MSDLSDLELVAQAMAPTDKSSQPTPQTDPQSTKPKSKTLDSETSISDDDANADAADDIDLDLSSLTPEDLALLQPLLSALNVSDPETLDESSLADVLKQINAAGEVADDLEGKLDKLIGELGRVEEGILEGMDDQSRTKGKGEGHGEDVEKEGSGEIDTAAKGDEKK